MKKKKKRKEKKKYTYFYLFATCSLFQDQDSCFSKCLSQSILASVLLLLKLWPDTSLKSLSTLIWQQSDSCKPSAYWLNLKARLRCFKALWTKLPIFDHSIVWQFPETWAQQKPNQTKYRCDQRSYVTNAGYFFLIQKDSTNIPIFPDIIALARLSTKGVVINHRGGGGGEGV